MAVPQTNKRAKELGGGSTSGGLRGGGRRSLKDLVMATGLVSRKVSVED